MFADISEAKMRAVRAALLLGWLVLIASLFWDPFSAAWTDPSATASPFRLTSSVFSLQGAAIAQQPYPMGNRIFWTMVVPLVPIFLLVFGHEAWRRVCPLSFLSQLPGYLSIQRSRTVLQRSTGSLEQQRRLISHDSWLHRNSWYVQFGILFVGLNARLLIINSDRLALAVALLGVMSAAVVTGYLWSGKTWCNYFCPANVVQRIYTEPRGLLESWPHLQRTKTPQSSCRTPGSRQEGGDKIACVGCTLHCGDIDLERSYWESIESPPRRNVYYMFPGLVLGFYGYYLAQAGRWDYYFSGVWTHEPGVVGRLLEPGLFLWGRAIAMPKLLAAPLFLATCVSLSLLLARMLEALYRSARARLSNAEAINHCLALTAFLSFNLFYAFGGRPTLALFPAFAVRAIDVLIIAVSAAWLWRTLLRTPFKYRRESLTMGLVEQLRKLKFDVSQYFEGRPLEALRPDEIYVLGKVLPAVSRGQRLTAYKNLVDDAITTGKTGSAVFLDVLTELRTEMGITEAEHAHIIGEIGVASDTNFDARTATAHEKARCLQNYFQIVGSALTSHIAAGRPLAVAVDMAEMRQIIRILRASLKISDAEHQSMLDWLASDAGLISKRIESNLISLMDLAAARFCLQSSELDDRHLPALEPLLVQRLESRMATVVHDLVASIAVLSDIDQSVGYAASMASIAGDCCALVLCQPVDPLSSVTWRASLPPVVSATLAGESPTLASDAKTLAVSYRQRDVVTKSHDLQHCLRCLIEDDEPAVAALALSACARLQLSAARVFADEVRARGRCINHPMMTEIVVNLAAPDRSLVAGDVANEPHIVIRRSGAPEQAVPVGAECLTVGSAIGNRAIIDHLTVAPYHFTLQRELGGLRLLRLDAAPVFVNGVELQGASALLESAAELSFVTATEGGPVVLVDPVQGRVPYQVQSSDAVTRMLWLAASSLFKDADIATLSRAARCSELRRYPAQAMLFEAGDASSEAYILRVGKVRQMPTAMHPEAATADEVQSATGWACAPEQGRSATVQIVSDFAIILAVTRDAAGEVAVPVRSGPENSPLPNHQSVEVAE